MNGSVDFASPRGSFSQPCIECAECSQRQWQCSVMLIMQPGLGDGSQKGSMCAQNAAVVVTSGKI